MDKQNNPPIKIISLLVFLTVQIFCLSCSYDSGDDEIVWIKTRVEIDNENDGTVDIYSTYVFNGSQYPTQKNNDVY